MATCSSSPRVWSSCNLQLIRTNCHRLVIPRRHRPFNPQWRPNNFNCFLFLLITLFFNSSLCFEWILLTWCGQFCGGLKPDKDSRIYKFGKRRYTLAIGKVKLLHWFSYFQPACISHFGWWQRKPDIDSQRGDVYSRLEKKTAAKVFSWDVALNLSPWHEPAWQWRPCFYRGLINISEETNKHVHISSPTRN